MKVLIIVTNISNPYLGPSTVGYNIQKGFEKIGALLEKENVEIRFLSINDHFSRRVSKNIEITHTARYPPVTFTGEIQALLNKPRERFDVVHCHTIYEIFPFLFDTKTIFTLHGIFWKEFHFKNSLYSRMYCLLAKTRLGLVFPKLTKLITVSPYVVQELTSKKFDTSKAVVIENPVSDGFFNVKKRDDNMILYPAALIPRKNQLRFLEAVSTIEKELKDYRIVFTGSGDPDYAAMLKRFVHKHSLTNVEFLGRVPYSQMLDLYSRASMVAQTSLEETSSMVCIEALATGTPVLASKVGGIPYTVKDGADGLLVNPLDVREIARNILVLTDKRLREKLGANAKRNAERFRSERIARKHLELYLSC